MPKGGARATGAHLVGPGRDVGEGGAGVEEGGHLGLSFCGEEGHGERGHHAVASLTPGGHRGRRDKSEDESKCDGERWPRTEWHPLPRRSPEEDRTAGGREPPCGG